VPSYAVLQITNLRRDRTGNQVDHRPGGVGVEIAALTAFLAPFLPYLVKAGETVAEEAGKAFGDQAWAHAKALWERLRPSLEEEEPAKKAADRVAARPDDERAVTALELELDDLMTADAGLRADLEVLWSQARAANVVSATGERSAAVGGNVIGSTIITGDDAQIGS
jgi:hypothetical protein